ncbi:MAG: hypothetical protein HY434_00820 [Candidatus Liptonbacteria bacterium]|nr:hypothetical protein [Parcubacteria group bacterium]MBI4087359.1 hypothetical protein [Candidatus Liptonbacteria bacterium]
MSIINEIKNIKSTPRDLRNFGIMIGAIFLCLGLIFLYFGKPSGPTLAVVGALLLASGFLTPNVLRPLYKAWMAFGVVMGFLVTTVILTLFFYIILTPLALILRLFGKHFLDLDFRSGEKSYWRRRPSTETARIGLEKQF